MLNLFLYRIESLTQQATYHHICILTSMETCLSHFKDIEKTLSAIEADGKEAIIMRDTNCDYLNPLNNDAKHIKKIAHKLGFSHIIKEATRRTADTKTNIDHIFTNKPEFVRTSGVIHCGMSDHDPDKKET